MAFPLSLTPEAIRLANETYRQIVWTCIESDTPITEQLLRDIIPRRVHTWLINAKQVQPPSEDRQPDSVRFGDVDDELNSSYWVSPAYKDKLLEHLSHEVDLAEMALWENGVNPFLDEEVDDEATINAVGDGGSRALDNQELFNRCQEQTGVTVARLAKKLGIGETTLQRILHGATTKNKKIMFDFARAMKQENAHELLLKDKAITK